jgi:hypothetical protein
MKAITKHVLTAIVLAGFFVASSRSGGRTARFRGGLLGRAQAAAYNCVSNPEEGMAHKIAFLIICIYLLLSVLVPPHSWMCHYLLACFRY